MLDWMTSNYELTVAMRGGQWVATVRVLDAGPDDHPDYPARFEGIGVTPDQAVNTAFWAAASALDGLPKYLYHPHEYSSRAKAEAITASEALRWANAPRAQPQA